VSLLSAAAYPSPALRCSGAHHHHDGVTGALLRFSGNGALLALQSTHHAALLLRCCEHSLS
jgi:hypothetical protein